MKSITVGDLLSFFKDVDPKTLVTLEVGLEFKAHKVQLLKAGIARGDNTKTFPNRVKIS